jgi:hypothetical protein
VSISVVGSEDAGTSIAKPGKAKGLKKERAVTCVVHGIMARVTQAGTDPLMSQTS